VSTEHPSHEQLTAFQWGKLEAADQEAVSEHIANCEECCEALHQIPEGTLVGNLRTTVRVEGTEDAEGLPLELRDHPRYQIGKFLGAGGMGLVYQAEHRLMNRVVALKIIHRELSRNPKVLHRFHQEVKAAARLSHPNIVTAYDAEQAGDVHFLVMEFVDGLSLDRLVQRRGGMELAYACNYVRQAAKGLQHALEAGMVHRDIKPQNLMLTKKGQIKILDFGLARLASESREDLDGSEGVPIFGATKFGDILGTPDFMAPEQTLDSSTADIRADIYSLGCTFYYLLAGHPPFAGSTRTKIMSQRHQRPVPIAKLREDVPTELAAILDKMLTKELADRYQTPAEVVAALTNLGRPAPAPKPAAPKPAAPPKPPLPVTPPPDSEETIGRASRKVVVRCPFCQAEVRVSRRALGESMPCPKCSCYFTAASEHDRIN
jgi:eukaryotic-like serine/threonine-protein kinase